MGRYNISLQSSHRGKDPLSLHFMHVQHFISNEFDEGFRGENEYITAAMTLTRFHFGSVRNLVNALLLNGKIFRSITANRAQTAAPFPCMNPKERFSPIQAVFVHVQSV